MKQKIKSVYQNEVQKVFHKYNYVTPSKLVEVASVKTNGLHPFFNWDNKKAAHQYRLHQARNLIRVVTVQTKENGNKERLLHVPVDITVKGESKEGKYKPVSVIIKTPSEFEAVFNELSLMIRGAKRKLNLLSSAAENDDNTVLIGIVMQAFHTAEIALNKIH